MKKLLFNGCSFAAGDEVAWEDFKKATNSPQLTWPPKSHTAYKDYVEFRKQFALSGVVSKLMNLPVVDLSTDGNSNDNIALCTIGYLSKLTPEERQEFHVVIGWTALRRQLKWSIKEKTFLNLNVMHLDSVEKYPVQSKFRNWMIESLVNTDEEDHITNYMKNLILLESYLKSNHIPYTFWKSLDSFGSNIIPHIHLPLSAAAQTQADIDFNILSDVSRWVQIKEYTDTPWIKPTWAEQLEEDRDSNFISKENHHPNKHSIARFADLLVSKLKSA